MAEIKTKENNASVTDFIDSNPNERRRKDGHELLKIFKEVTGEKPKMWGTSIIGFGKFHYKSERSAQEGDWPLAGFSTRKQNLTIYTMLGIGDFSEHLKKLGKHKKSVGCIYINKLEDVDIKVLKKIIEVSYTAVKQKYSVK